MNFKRYLGSVFNGLYRVVIKRAWPIWGTPLTIYLALLTPYSFKYFDVSFWNPDFHLRASGFGLQMLFVVIVVIDIIGLMKDFDRPSLIESVKKWFIDLYVVFVPQARHAKFNGGNYSKKMGTGGIYPSLGQKDLDIERRVEILEERLQEYMEETNEKIQELRADINTLRKDLKNERQEREQDLKKFKGFVERISTKGLKREGAALVWLFVGLLLSIFPTELSFILNWL